MIERRRRSVAKSLSWRVIASLSTVAIVLLLTGEVQLAVTVGGVEVIAKLLIFYIHERVWGLVRWGFVQ